MKWIDVKLIVCDSFIERGRKLKFLVFQILESIISVKITIPVKCTPQYSILTYGSEVWNLTDKVCAALKGGNTVIVMVSVIITGSREVHEEVSRGKTLWLLSEMNSNKQGSYSDLFISVASDMSISTQVFIIPLLPAHLRYWSHRHCIDRNYKRHGYPGTTDNRWRRWQSTTATVTRHQYFWFEHSCYPAMLTMNLVAL